MGGCVVCRDTGWHRLETTHDYEVYGVEFEIKALPCPLCPVGRRNAIMVARWDVRGARAVKQTYRGRRLCGWSSPAVLLKRFPPIVEHDQFGYSAWNDTTLAVGTGSTMEGAVAEYLSEVRRFIRQSGDPVTWPCNLPERTGPDAPANGPEGR